jgi:hypothetical protein
VQASGLGRWVRKGSTEGATTPALLTPRPREGSRLAKLDAGALHVQLVPCMYE